MRAQIDIPDDVAAELYRRAPRPAERQALLSDILREYFATHPVVASGLDTINRNAEELNREAAEVLDYQVIR
jgi:hypothetical protein